MTAHNLQLLQGERTAFCPAIGVLITDRIGSISMKKTHIPLAKHHVSVGQASFESFPAVNSAKSIPVRKGLSEECLHLVCHLQHSRYCCLVPM